MHRRHSKNPRARWNSYDVQARKARRAQRLILALGEDGPHDDPAARQACYRTMRRAMQTARVANMRIQQLIFDM